MSIRCYEGRYIVTYFRRGIHMTYSCINVEEAQSKLREMCNETIVDLTHRRLYFQPDQILELHFPKVAKSQCPE